MRSGWMAAIGVAALIGLASPALARYQKLSAPSIAYASGTPRATVDKILAALNRPDCRFLEGHALNSWTSLKYQGATPALSQFLEALSKCPGTTVSVAFKKRDDASDWTVGHLGSGMHFQVEVNLNSSRINLEELSIPESRGPAKE